MDRSAVTTVGKSLITGCGGAASIGGGDFAAGTEEVSCGVEGPRTPSAANEGSNCW